MDIISRTQFPQGHEGHDIPHTQFFRYLLECNSIGRNHSRYLDTMLSETADKPPMAVLPNPRTKCPQAKPPPLDTTSPESGHDRKSGRILWRGLYLNFYRNIWNVIISEMMRASEKMRHMTVINFDIFVIEWHHCICSTQLSWLPFGRSSIFLLCICCTKLRKTADVPRHNSHHFLIANECLHLRRCHAAANTCHNCHHFLIAKHCLHCIIVSLLLTIVTLVIISLLPVVVNIVNIVSLPLTIVTVVISNG